MLIGIKISLLDRGSQVSQESENIGIILITLYRLIKTRMCNLPFIKISIL